MACDSSVKNNKREERLVSIKLKTFTDADHLYLLFSSLLLSTAKWRLQCSSM